MRKLLMAFVAIFIFASCFVAGSSLLSPRTQSPSGGGDLVVEPTAVENGQIYTTSNFDRAPHLFDVGFVAGQTYYLSVALTGTISSPGGGAYVIDAIKTGYTDVDWNNRIAACEVALSTLNTQKVMTVSFSVTSSMVNSCSRLLLWYANNGASPNFSSATISVRVWSSHEVIYSTNSWSPTWQKISGKLIVGQEYFLSVSLTGSVYSYGSASIVIDAIKKSRDDVDFDDRKQSCETYITDLVSRRNMTVSFVVNDDTAKNCNAIYFWFAGNGYDPNFSSATIKVKIYKTLPSIPEKTSFSIYANSGSLSASRSTMIKDISLTYYGYGFKTNSSGYFESTNKYIDNSYSMMVVSFYANLSSSSFTINYISYGESNYDYAIFGNLDSRLTESYSADSSYKKRTYGESSSSLKTLTYTGISIGWHNIWIKYRKDGSNSNYNDSLQLYFEQDQSSTSAKYQFKGLRYGTLPSATRTGYTFKGWYTSSSGGTNITSTSIYNGSSIYAQWNINSYTITVIKGDVGIADITNPATSWNYNGGNVVGGGKQITVDFGTSRTISVAMVGGYSFSKWSGDSTSTSSSITCTISSAKNYTYTATSKANSYTVTFNAQGGTASSASKTVTFNSAYGSLPTATRTNYTFDGWYTSSSNGTKITSTSTYTTVGNQTLYAHWTPVSITNYVYLRVISKDGGSVTETTAGGSVSVTRNVISGSSSSAQTTNQTSISGTYQCHQGQEFKLVAKASTDYVFVGYSTSSTPSDSIRNPSYAANTTTSFYPTSGTSYYAYFKQVSSNLLKYDTTDKYFYFEDGFFPQSEATVSASTLNSSARANGETITYYGENDKGTLEEISLPVYTYGSDRYVKVDKKSGGVKWFKFEPIRWRISDYGTELTERNLTKYDTLIKFKNYSSYATNFVAVSDLILGVGAMNSTRKVTEGTSVTTMSAYTHTRDITDECLLGTVHNQSSYSIKVQSYSTYSQQNAVTESSANYATPLRVVSLEELNAVGLSNKQARMSDMVRFILGLDNNVETTAYWTRDLSNLGSGVAISASGSQTRPWLDQMLGVRFAYNFDEGSSLHESASISDFDKYVSNYSISGSTVTVSKLKADNNGDVKVPWGQVMIDGKQYTVKLSTSYLLDGDVHYNTITIPAGVTLDTYMLDSEYTAKKIILEGDYFPEGAYWLGANPIAEEIEIKGTFSVKNASGIYAFGNSRANVKAIRLHQTTPPTLTSSTTLTAPHIQKIYVPASAVNAYKNAQYWSSCADLIVGY